MYKESAKYLFLFVVIIIILLFFLTPTNNQGDKTTHSDDELLCAQVITYAMNPNTKECESFPTPCDVPKSYTECEEDPYASDIDENAIVLYYPKGEIGNDCTIVHPLKREIERQYETIEVDVLISLISQLSDEEKEQGYHSSIPEGTRLKNLTISQGTATADFSEELNRAGGSCANGSIYTQIEKTLLQFPDIDKVIISVEGSVDDALQP